MLLQQGGADRCRPTRLTGTGGPERLKGDLPGYASRRINKAHQLIYWLEQGVLTLIARRYHYG
ncbi:type II toxin-antitoxin system YoeB family toxin [Pseudomonas typographi]|uniref:Type II toxin-antitoxin system YoeB family toxin n=1 Tax=Pseudomonas typographi TaxID=2715964 RepID=A0ABR7Z6Q0_9PSED|nr:type II toxin-antitoxin system YoeB family toxin [Pseudomonas typographi]MBD1600984.1 type II toxin-antitoxin system YoeB family toxin [Pseudomonas typographi]